MSYKRKEDENYQFGELNKKWVSARFIKYIVSKLNYIF